MTAAPPLFLPDQAEQELLQARTDGRLLHDLSPALLIELSEGALLEPLLRRRIESLVKAAYHANRLEGASEAVSWPEALAREWFEAQVDRRYLERRDALERVSFRLLRTPQKGVVLEAQQRLLNREEDWVSISERWGIDPEKRFNGRIAPTPPTKLAPELTAALRRLQPGDLSEPIRLGKLFALVELEQWLSVDLTDDLRRQLEKELLDAWLDDQLAGLITSLDLPEHPESDS